MSNARYIGEVAPTLGRKNLLINGDFSIWQRGTSFASPGYQYAADHWYVGNGTCSRQSLTNANKQAYNLSSSHYCLVVPSSGQTALVRQPIELAGAGNQGPFVVGRKVTASFTAWSSATTEAGVGLFSRTGVAAGTVTYIATTQNVNLTTTPTRFEVTFTIDTSVGASDLLVALSIGCVTADRNLNITEVQLEVGDTATDFEIMSVAETLLLCQRYYEQVSIGVLYRIYQSLNMGGAHDRVFLKVQKRTTPTVTVASTMQYYTGGTPANFSPSSWAVSATLIIWYVSSGLTTFCGWAGGVLAADAEF